MRELEDVRFERIGIGNPHVARLGSTHMPAGDEKPVSVPAGCNPG